MEVLVGKAMGGLYNGRGRRELLKRCAERVNGPTVTPVRRQDKMTARPMENLPLDDGRLGPLLRKAT
jgi:hypothetical protein